MKNFFSLILGEKDAEQVVRSLRHHFGTMDKYLLFYKPERLNDLQNAFPSAKQAGSMRGHCCAIHAEAAVMAPA